MDLLTVSHTLISIAAILAGIPATAALMRGGTGWAGSFLNLAVATSVTGYFSPFQGVTPAIVVGAIALAILLLVILARYRFAFRGVWRRVYSIGMVASLYLLAFVAVAQAFQKIPALNRLAPTQGEPPFAFAQGALLVLFLVIGWRAAARFKPDSSA